MTFPVISGQKPTAKVNVKSQLPMPCRGVAAESVIAAAPKAGYDQQPCAAALILENAIVIPNLRR